MNKTILILLGTALLCFFQSLKAANGEAKLTIHLSNTKSVDIALEYNGQFNLIDKNYELYPVYKNESGYCELTIPLTTPQYYMLFRNPLYLSPGDNLTIDLNDDPALSKFEGTGAIVNNYLKKRFYLKGGSFLQTGNRDVVKPTLNETLIVLDSLVEARKGELAELKADDEFKRLETVRIKADFINSLLYYPDYNKQFFGENVKTIDKKEYPAIMENYYKQIKTRVQPLIEDINSDDRFLDIEVVRLVLMRFYNIKSYDLKMSEWFRNLYAVAEKAQPIRGSITEKQYDDFYAFGQTIKSEKMKSIYMDKLLRVVSFVSGKPAIDVVVTDVNGNKKNLSDYKGSILYVDVWATWCAPCLQEAPFFKALSEKYTNIRFISLSVDERKSAWDSKVKNNDHGKITELWTGPEMMKTWEIGGIPRFLLIDKDFNIIYAAAPRPREKESIEPLLEKYNRQP